MKLGTHGLCANMQKKTVERIFKILILKFLANFLNFTFVLSLCSSSSDISMTVRDTRQVKCYSCHACTTADRPH